MRSNFPTYEEKELIEANGSEVGSLSDAQRKPSDANSDREEEREKLLS